MKIESNLKPRTYTEKEVCRIVDPKQHRLYTKYRVYPIDMYPGVTDDNRDIVVYIYLRSETQELYKKWLNHELT